MSLDVNVDIYPLKVRARSTARGVCCLLLRLIPRATFRPTTSSCSR
jgi:hypothetical protein